MLNLILLESNGKESVLFSYFSPDGEEGYPGGLDINVQYTLTDNNALEMEYFGVSDQDNTVINLTSHAYFNLGGHASGSIEPHELMINADKFTVVDKYYPNSLVHEHFPSPIFRANQEYRHKTILKFSAN